MGVVSSSFIELSSHDTHDRVFELGLHSLKNEYSLPKCTFLDDKNNIEMVLTMLSHNVIIITYKNNAFYNVSTNWMAIIVHIDTKSCASTFWDWHIESSESSNPNYGADQATHTRISHCSLVELLWDYIWSIFKFASFSQGFLCSVAQCQMLSVKSAAKALTPTENQTWNWLSLLLVMLLDQTMR